VGPRHTHRSFFCTFSTMLMFSFVIAFGGTLGIKNNWGTLNILRTGFIGFNFQFSLAIHAARWPGRGAAAAMEGCVLPRRDVIVQCRMNGVAWRQLCAKIVERYR
jgi:hypothetical protein